MITYETKSTHPGTLPSATIYMSGLLCLGFDHANKCTVGVNSVGNGHKWKFEILEETDNTILVCEQDNPDDPSEIHIDVKGGTTGGAYVYNGTGTVSIPNSNEHRFNLESSWVDLEGHRGHNKPIENNRNTLWPRFYINEGLFCANKLSTGTFDLKDRNPTPLIKPLGKVALGVVADIFLDTSDPLSKIEVKLSSNTVSLDKNKRYQIFITNDCGADGPDKIDFSLHYKAFSGAFDGSHGKMNADDQFQLVYHQASATANAESILAQVRGGDSYATDRAPCMAVALGRTSTFKE